MRRLTFLALTVMALALLAQSAAADPFSFSTGTLTNQIATASRPGTPGIEIESADDFVLTAPTTIINQATFTGLVVKPGAATPTFNQVVVEIYRVFPKDSDVGRTSGPPTFSTPQVPTRVNSPSDVALDSRDSKVPGVNGLSFTTQILSSSFTANNSVQAGGIHPKPNQTTLGNGPITGQEVLFNVTFTTPFSLGPDHYFFVPQVQVNGGDFFWLSASRPIDATGTPFPPGFTDLQSWTRDANLDPDWLRIGTDIVDGSAPIPTFNAAFSLTGQAVPLPGSVLLFGSGLLGLAGLGRRKLRKS